MTITSKTRARLIGAVVTAAVVAGLGIAVAPSAMAVPDSVVLSSFDTGPIGVSGTATFSPTAPENAFFVTVGFPTADYTVGLGGSCASDGITASINGTPLVVACGNGTSGSFSTLVIYNYWSSPAISTADVITVTWGAAVATRSGVSSPASFGIATNMGPPAFMLVTPTLAGASVPGSGEPDSAVPDMTMWQQSIGRSSGEASCPTGYTNSWAQWPNGNQGGWVCNRELRAYQSNFDE